MEREVNIIILNVIDFKNKKTDKDNCRIGYIYADKDYITNNDRLLGRSEQAVYFEGSYRNHFNIDDLNKVFTLVIGEKPSKNNPLRTRLVPVELKKDNKIFIKF